MSTNDRFDDPGEFVTLSVWEWSDDRGHANVYLGDADVAASSGDYTDGQDESHPGEARCPDGSFAVPHHTTSEARPYWTEYDWGRPNEDAPLVEVVQSRGSFGGDERDLDGGP